MGCQHGEMSRKLVAVALLSVMLASCRTSGDSTGTIIGTTIGSGQACELGNWASASMDAPSQAGVGDLTSTVGGDGMMITLGADGLFQIDFGPMKPTTGTFVSGGQPASLDTTFSGVGKGTWKSNGDTATASFDDFTTVTTTVTITLGETVPPVFDETLQQLNDDRMLNGEKAGVFTISGCTATTLTLTTPYPGGAIVIHAVPVGP